MKKEVREGYKMTELGEIPNEWQIKNLEDISYLIDGDRSSRYPGEKDIVEHGILFLSTQNIINSKIVYKNCKFITEEKFDELSKGKLQKNDLIITLRGSIGNVAKFNGDIYDTGFINAQIMIIRSNDINPTYLSKYLISVKSQKQITSISSGSAQPQLTKSELKKLKVIVPSEYEQKKIAEILSTVDKQIENTEKLIQKNQELKKGLMQQLLTKGIGHTEFKKTELGNIPKEWEIVKFDSVIELLTDYEANGSFSSIKENVNIYNEKNYAYFVRATDLEKKDYINSVKYVDEKSYEFLSKTELKGGELLISKRGQIGKVYLMPNLNIKCTLAPNLYLIKLLNDKVDNSYMYHYFTSSRGQKLLVRNSASTTLGAIYKEDLKKINILLPTIDEQRRISRILSNVEGKILNNQNKKEKLEELKKGLMQRLLTGYIRVI
ncbi:restriction endonuclease subunit S [Clostridium perfringens]